MTNDSLDPAKGLSLYYRTGSKRGIQPGQARRLRMMLAALDTATALDDLDLPGFRLHPLAGPEAGRWSIRVSGNWRLTFAFEAGDVWVLDYEDYH